MEIKDLSPTKTVSAAEVFGVNSTLKVPAFAEASDYVPAIDTAYQFDPATTLAVLAGFVANRRVLVQGLHGTGKSTHIEQIAARLNWPLLRINLDSHVSRIDLVGRDAIVLKDGLQVTEYKEGLLPWALQRPVALVFDEYDAGRPDVMFVIQRVLEAEGRLTLLEANRVITPNKHFRLFATANTIGLGDHSGLYHGTQPINQGQMDRWNIVARLDYLPFEAELKIVRAKVADIDEKTATAMVKTAELTREGFKAGDLSTVMSPRTVISWAENTKLFGNVGYAFRVSFYNKCDETERATLEEYFQRAFGTDMPDAPSDLKVA